MYYVHCDYTSNESSHKVRSFATIEEATKYIRKFMVEHEIDASDAMVYFIVIKGEAIALGMQEVNKTVTVKDIVLIDTSNAIVP